VFVKLPVMTAVEGATGRAKRKRANWHAMAETAIIAVMPAIKPCGLADGLVMTLKIKTPGEQQKLNQEEQPRQARPRLPDTLARSQVARQRG
jgi:hypothetical protein